LLILMLQLALHPLLLSYVCYQEVRACPKDSFHEEIGNLLFLVNLINSINQNSFHKIHSQLYLLQEVPLKKNTIFWNH